MRLALLLLLLTGCSTYTSHAVIGYYEGEPVAFAVSDQDHSFYGINGADLTEEERDIVLDIMKQASEEENFHGLNIEHFCPAPGIPL